MDCAGVSCVCSSLPCTEAKVDKLDNGGNSSLLMAMHSGRYSDECVQARGVYVGSREDVY